jgi:hypothetical protein
VGENPREFTLKDGLAVKKKDYGTAHPHAMTEASQKTEEQR